jgi:cephalosporin hydroxylase
MIGEEYHQWYYENRIWEQTTFLGVPALKSVSDLWNYQEILVDFKPSLIVEFGTWSGGSALYFATIMDWVSDDYHILSVDVDHAKVSESVYRNSHIELLQSDTTNPAVAERIRVLRNAHPGPMFCILDSDHHKEHVLSELMELRSMTVPGDYLVVEDSNINGHPVRADFGEGPYEALEEYFARYPNDYIRDVRREEKFGFTFAKNGFLIRTGGAIEPRGTTTPRGVQLTALIAGYAQAFWPGDRGYEEPESSKMILRANDWQNVRFEIPAGGPPGAIRLDPLNRPGLIEIGRLAITVEGRPVWTLTSGERSFAVVCGTAMRLAGESLMTIFSFGGDPQLLLGEVPLAEDGRGATGVALEGQVRASTDLRAIADWIACREAHIESNERNLVEFRNSISWRATAPLRALTRLLGYGRSGT